MSNDSSKKRYVSTLKIHLTPASTSLAQGDRLATRNTTSRNGKDPLSGSGSRLSSPLRGLDPPLFTEPLEDCSVDEGSDIILRGLVTGCRPITVSWRHNGEVIRFGQPLFDGRVAKLAVRGCRPEDAGAYTCLAENPAGKTSSSAAVCVRDLETIRGVRNRASQNPPTSSRRAMKNGSSTSPLSPLSPEDNPRVFRHTSFSTSPTTPRPGEPCKEVTPKKRADSATAPAVQFEDPPNHVEARVGEPARLTCVFSGSPPVVSCWIRNKEQVVDGSELWVESSDQSSTLVIGRARPGDAGLYTVVVKDRRSSAQHTITLSVVDRPQPPASSPVVTLLSPSSLVLSWSGPCFDGGIAVLGYVVEVHTQGPAKPGDWSELTAQCKSTSYRVRSGLKPQGRYRFRVRAYNSVGVSEPSQESEEVNMEQEGKQEEESPPPYQDVTIDSIHKVAEHYTVMEKLGVGKFGQVFKLRHKETGRVCAGKFYKGRRAKESLKNSLSKAVFTPSSLLSGRGGLHMAQIVLSLVTFVLAAFQGETQHTYWNYAMFIWAFCPLVTLFITIIEMFLLHILLGLCMDWDDFTTGMAMSSSLMTLSIFVVYANFYACRVCFYSWVVSGFALLCGVLYTLEVIKDKFLDGKTGSYLAALPGFWKVLEAFVSCIIFVSVTGYDGKPALILCLVAYIIPFPIIPFIIATNIFKKLKNCLPFNIDRFVFIFLVISVVLYAFAALLWPIYTFRNNPRPNDCPGSFCIWAIQFIVAFMTYVNLILFIVDLVFTLLGICGFKRT